MGIERRGQCVPTAGVPASSLLIDDLAPFAIDADFPGALLRRDFLFVITSLPGVTLYAWRLNGKYDTF